MCSETRCVRDEAKYPPAIGDGDIEKTFSPGFLIIPILREEIADRINPPNLLRRRLILKKYNFKKISIFRVVDIQRTSLLLAKTLGWFI